MTKHPRQDSNLHHPITATGLEVQTDTRACLHCDKSTTNPKFCSRSCAATYNNTKHPKRKVESTCAYCGKPNTKARTYCKDCWLIFVANQTDWSKITIGELKGMGNAIRGGRLPYTRTLSRKWYLQSDKPKHCVVCGYDTHFDVAHIKAVESFSLDATVGEVNNLDNLIALCKNHHWEFDNGKLDISHLIH